MAPSKDTRDNPSGTSYDATWHSPLKGRLPAIDRSYLTLAGDPCVGRIHHLAWHHDAANGMDREERIHFGERNAAILHQLKALGVRSVFIEGHDTGDKVTDLVEPKDLQRLASYFPNHRLPTRLSEYQAVILAEVSLGSATAYFYPDVSIHGADTRSKIRDRSYRSNDPVLSEAIVYHYRESLALDAIISSFEGKPAEERVAALIFGANHVFDRTDIPESVSHLPLPEITKHTFEGWSIYQDTEKLMRSGSAVERILNIRFARRLLYYVWGPELTSTEQHLILPKLKVSPDFFDSPEQLRARLLRSVADGPRREEVEDTIERLYQQKSGPFSDLVPRPRSGAALKRVPGEFESGEIYDEKHPFTQLEMIRRASRVQWWAFGSIISSKGQLAALDKLIPENGATKESLVNDLLRRAGSKDVRAEIIRRHGESLAPFDQVP